MVDGVKQNIWIDPEEETNDVFFEKNWPGQHTYVLRGCIKNSEFDQSPADDEKIYISLGETYQNAETTLESSVFITPLITTGNLGLS